MEDFEACIAHLRLPIRYRKATRATNEHLLERLYVEKRRRQEIVPNAFGECPLLKRMCGAMIRAKRSAGFAPASKRNLAWCVLMIPRRFEDVAPQRRGRYRCSSFCHCSSRSRVRMS